MGALGQAGPIPAKSHDAVTIIVKRVGTELHKVRQVGCCSELGHRASTTHSLVVYATSASVSFQAKFMFDFRASR